MKSTADLNRPAYLYFFHLVALPCLCHLVLLYKVYNEILRVVLFMRATSTACYPNSDAVQNELKEN
jgi:hypothetical protein